MHFLAADESARKPTEVARELLQVYGKKLDDVTYIPALSVYCRQKFADLTGERKYADEVRELIGPYLREEKTAKTDSQVAIAGHLVFSTGSDKRVAELLNEAAKSVKPPSAQEMSDAVFMCGPLLCEAGRHSGEQEHFASAVAYLTKMAELRQRGDRLYAHGHLCDTAWGRGNGFPAVGMAWCLSLLPADQSGRDKLLESFRQHMAALLEKQDDAGMWHQVIDHPASAPEFTCTCMIGFAMQRGISRGWLSQDKYQPAVDKAWRAICRRVEPVGKLLGVCESTGTQRTEEAYLGRKVGDGVDQRGGAMGLLFATELMAAEKTREK
jgi:rhamnogalacturonyl hydrolase YesR